MADDTEKVFIKKMYGVKIPKDPAERPSTISHMRFSEGIFADYFQSINGAAISRGTIQISYRGSVGIIKVDLMLDEHRAASPGYVSSSGGINILSPLSQGIPVNSSPSDHGEESGGTCGLCDKDCEAGERVYPLFKGRCRPSWFPVNVLMDRDCVSWIYRGYPGTDLSRTKLLLADCMGFEQLRQWRRLGDSRRHLDVVRDTVDKCHLCGIVFPVIPEGVVPDKRDKKVVVPHQYPQFEGFTICRFDYSDMEHSRRKPSKRGCSGGAIGELTRAYETLDLETSMKALAKRKKDTGKFFDEKLLDFE